MKQTIGFLALLFICFVPVPISRIRGQGIVEAQPDAHSKVFVPKEMKGIASLSWMEYDPVHDTLYVMKMGSELYRWKRP